MEVVCVVPQFFFKKNGNYIRIFFSVFYKQDGATIGGLTSSGIAFFSTDLLECKK
jgi:hypothetical protein